MEDTIVSKPPLSTKELPDSYKRKMSKSKERKRVTLGGEIKFSEEDYARMNLVTYR